MNKTPKDYIFESYLLEYGKHRDEIQNRINLQNSMARQAMNITVLIVTLIASIFTFLTRAFQATANVSFASSIIVIFLPICIPILFVHGVFIQLTIAAWIYQLNMIFKIIRYWNWIVVHKINPMIEGQQEVFLWDLIKNPPYDEILERKLLKFFKPLKLIEYFQPLFIYALCILNLIALIFACTYYQFASIPLFDKVFSTLGPSFLCCTFLSLLIVHKRLVSTNIEGKQNFQMHSSDIIDKIKGL